MYEIKNNDNSAISPDKKTSHKSVESSPQNKNTVQQDLSDKSRELTLNEINNTPNRSYRSAAKKGWLMWMGIFVGALLLIFAILYKPVTTTLSQSSDIDIIIFVGQECPYSKMVLDYISHKHIDKRVKFEVKEIWHNKENEDLAYKKSLECNFGGSTAVPFLYSNEKCVRDPNQINSFLKKKSGIFW